MMLAPDPAVPQRDALLDERYMASRLGAVRCERINAKYRVGDSLRVVYRADTDRVLAGRTFRGRSRSVFRRAAAASEPGAVLHLEELETVFWTFPNDRRLAGLRVFDPRSGALEALVGAPVARTRLMAYAPERAATAECRDADDRVLAYVKVHWDAAERELDNTEAAGAAVGMNDPHLRLARVLAHSLPDQALVYEPLAGDRLDGIDDLAPALRALGAALATLHDVRPLPERRFDRLDPERLALAAEVVGRARPDCARAAAALHARLAGGPPESEPVHLHGDANLRNALLDGGRVGLVDLEDAAAGPAAADLGFVIAALLARGKVGEWALLDGYSRVAPVPSAEVLRWHVAASVLARVAVPAVGRIRPALLGRLKSLLEQVA
jgi:Ser/Thr protein kinase RdoA (MazF antagonist)